MNALWKIDSSYLLGMDEKVENAKAKFFYGR